MDGATLTEFRGIRSQWMVDAVAPKPGRAGPTNPHLRKLHPKALPRWRWAQIRIRHLPRTTTDRSRYLGLSHRDARMLARKRTHV